MHLDSEDVQSPTRSTILGIELTTVQTWDLPAEE